MTTLKTYSIFDAFALVVQRLAYLEKFYRVLLADSSKMNQVGVKKAELSQMKAAIEALMDVRLKHTSFKGEAQHRMQRKSVMRHCAN